MRPLPANLLGSEPFTADISLTTTIRVSLSPRTSYSGNRLRSLPGSKAPSQVLLVIEVCTCCP